MLRRRKNVPYLCKAMSELVLLEPEFDSEEAVYGLMWPTQYWRKRTEKKRALKTVKDENRESLAQQAQIQLHSNNVDKMRTTLESTKQELKDHIAKTQVLAVEAAKACRKRQNEITQSLEQLNKQLNGYDEKTRQFEFLAAQAKQADDKATKMREQHLAAEKHRLELYQSLRSTLDGKSASAASPAVAAPQEKAVELVNLSPTESGKPAAAVVPVRPGLSLEDMLSSTSPSDANSDLFGDSDPLRAEAAAAGKPQAQRPAAFDSDDLFANIGATAASNSGSSAAEGGEATKTDATPPLPVDLDPLGVQAAAAGQTPSQSVMPHQAALESTDLAAAAASLEPTSDLSSTSCPLSSPPWEKTSTPWYNNGREYWINTETGQNWLPDNDPCPVAGAAAAPAAALGQPSQSVMPHSAALGTTNPGEAAVDAAAAPEPPTEELQDV